jgi:hypothetical protein
MSPFLLSSPLSPPLPRCRRSYRLCSPAFFAVGGHGLLPLTAAWLDGESTLATPLTLFSAAAERFLSPAILCRRKGARVRVGEWGEACNAADSLQQFAFLSSDKHTTSSPEKKDIITPLSALSLFNTDTHTINRLPWHSPRAHRKAPPLRPCNLTWHSRAPCRHTVLVLCFGGGKWFVRV